MDEYLNRESLIAELSKGTLITDDIYGMGIMTGLGRALNVARELPAADVVERMRGEWVYSADGTPHCSECGVEVEPERISRFCPDCGARLEDDDHG